MEPAPPPPSVALIAERVPSPYYLENHVRWCQHPILHINVVSRTDSPNSNSTPIQRKAPQRDHHRRRHACPDHPDSSLPVAAEVLADTASADRHSLPAAEDIRPVAGSLVEDRTGPAEDLAGKGWGCRHSTRGRLHRCCCCCCSRRLAHRLGRRPHHDEWEAGPGGKRAVRLGPVIMG